MATVIAEMVRWMRKRETFVLPYPMQFSSALWRASCLSGLTMTFVLSLLRLGCNPEFHGCVGSGNMGDCIVYPFTRF